MNLRYSCWSYVGKQTGRQLLLFNKKCTTGEVITYELGHAIGLFSPAPEEIEVRRLVKFHSTSKLMYMQ